MAFRLKSWLFALILGVSPIFYANAQITTTFFDQQASFASSCYINGTTMTVEDITDHVIIADGLDIPDGAFRNSPNILSVTAAGSIKTIGVSAFRSSTLLLLMM